MIGKLADYTLVNHGNKGVFICVFRLASLGPLIAHQLLQQLEGWADEYKGDYELRILGRRVIVIADPVKMRRIMAQRPSLFRRGLSPVSASSGRVLTAAASRPPTEEGA